MADPMQVYVMGPPPRQGETYPPQTAPPSNNPPQGGYPSQHIPQGGYPPEYPSQGNHLPPQGVYSEEFKKSPDYGGKLTKLHHCL
ncbi:hypothetical protein JTB14_004273 [Gonioctena quinquepunctata]|nr:hypothetical protein JTB14_004273 [Gonioctena quinquepunctata]